MDKKKTPQQHWLDVVSESNGTRAFLPDDMAPRAKTWAKERNEFMEKIAIQASSEIRARLIEQQMLVEFREAYAKKTGDNSIWLKEIGFDNNALHDGIFVVNIAEPRG